MCVNRKRETEREMNGGGDDEDVVVAAASSGDASAPLQWRFSQVFGERSAGEEVQPGNKKSSLLTLDSHRDYSSSDLNLSNWGLGFSGFV